MACPLSGSLRLTVIGSTACRTSRPAPGFRFEWIDWLTEILVNTEVAASSTKIDFGPGYRVYYAKRELI